MQKKFCIPADNTHYNSHHYLWRSLIYTDDPTFNFQEEEQKDEMSLWDEPLLNRKQAALFLNVSPGTIAVWDCTRRYDLRPFKVGNRVHYSKANLIRFLNEQLKEK